MLSTVCYKRGSLAHKLAALWHAMTARIPLHATVAAVLLCRAAPLSQGRVDTRTGCLQCAYHGWQFGSDGKCTGGLAPQQWPRGLVKTTE